MIEDAPRARADGAPMCTILRQSYLAKMTPGGHQILSLCSKVLDRPLWRLQASSCCRLLMLRHTVLPVRCSQNLQTVLEGHVLEVPCSQNKCLAAWHLACKLGLCQGFETQPSAGRPACLGVQLP